MRSAARLSLSFKLLVFQQRLELSLVVRLISGTSEGASGEVSPEQPRFIR